MPGRGRLGRRRFTARLASIVLAGGVAGCSDDGDSVTPPATTGSETGGPTTGRDTDRPTPTDTATPASETARETPSTDAEPDRREANVVGVEYERVDGGYRFDVSLDHDDAGEDGYADWWQVETTLGSRLGRRDLAHPHSTQPFTRSATIAVPDDRTCVVVRGHDQTHGYGGRAVIVNLELDTSRQVDQGPDPRRFDPGDCP